MRHLLRVSLSATLILCGCSGGQIPVSERVTARLGTPASPRSEAPPIDARALLARARVDFQSLAEVADNPANPMTEEKIALGRKLYFDTRLSKNHDVSCESCHHLAEWGVDGEPTSLGHRGQRGDRNAPTVYNAGFHLAQFWDGRAADLEEQAKGPLLNPLEMALPDEQAATAVIASIPGYVEEFQQVFPDEGVTYENIARAIAAFERKLSTRAPFDDFLEGNTDALSEDQQRGLAVFYEAGCVTCHTGMGVGGHSYQKLGVRKPFVAHDQGRFVITGNDADRHVFKVPSLRNVARTGPYLHDGSVATLPDMVALMAEYQTTKARLSADETRWLLAFLDALTGPLPADYIRAPALPESGPRTPAPDPT